MRTFVLGCVSFGLLAVAVACGSSFPRDMNFGTDAGADFQPPMWDAPVALPDGIAEDGMGVDAGSIAGP